LTREGDDLADDELGDRTRVGKGRVEDGDSGLGGGLEVDLVGSDAETADGKELPTSRSIQTLKISYRNWKIQYFSHLLARPT
jgi:hypothetical protein